MPSTWRLKQGKRLILSFNLLSVNKEALKQPEFSNTFINDLKKFDRFYGYLTADRFLRYSFGPNPIVRLNSLEK